MNEFNFLQILKLFIALSLFISCFNSSPISSQIHQEQVEFRTRNVSSSSPESTKSPYAISFVSNTSVYDTSNSSSFPINSSRVEQLMQQFSVKSLPLNVSLNSKSLLDDTYNKNNISNSTSPKQMRQTFLYKYFNTTMVPKSSFNSTSKNNDEVNMTSLININQNINASSLTKFTFEAMNSYVHVAPQMFYFFMNSSKMFYIDYVPDVEMPEMDAQEKEIVQDLIKEAIVRYKRIDDKENICVKIYEIIDNIENDETSQNHQGKFVHYKILVNTHFLTLNEQDFENSLIEFSQNKWKCSLNETTGLINNLTDAYNETIIIGNIVCYPYVGKDLKSLLKLHNHWFRLVLKSNVINFSNTFGVISDRLASSISGFARIFAVQPAWIIGLSIIGCIIGIFFFGCIIAICYTRRPYRRSSKIYELDYAYMNNNNVGSHHIGGKGDKRPRNTPQIPGIHPTTRTTIQTRKELLYQ